MRAQAIRDLRSAFLIPDRVARWDSAPTISAALGIPGVNVCGVTCTGSVLLGVIGTDADRGDLEFIGDSSPFFFLSNNFYFGDTLTVVRGNQAYKFGGDVAGSSESTSDGRREC